MAGRVRAPQAPLGSPGFSSSPQADGLSMTSTLANAGNILSLLVGMATKLYPALPLFIYRVVSVTACTVTIFLPETLGQPNTIQDLERRWAAPSLTHLTHRATRSSQLLDPFRLDQKRPDPGDSRDLHRIIQPDSGGAKA